MRLPLRLVVLTLLATATIGPALAQSTGSAADIWRRDTLTGDWGGARTTLADQGITISLSYTGDLQDNSSGGIRRGAVYDSLLQPQVDLDLAKLLGWTGATAHISAIAIAGPSLSSGYAGNLLNTSSINGRPAIRLYNAWAQQNIGSASIRVGLMNVDAEFFTSQTASVFVESTFGWPGILALDLPGGGPAYPLSSPGVRVKWQASPGFSVVGGVFSGDPTGGDGSNSLAVMQPDATRISFTGGALAIMEADFALNQDKEAKGPPTTLKLGAWYASSTHFQDQRFDNGGLSLADPASDGSPRNHDGDWGIYGIIDTTLYQAPGGGGAGLSAFARVAGAPAAQNLISFYADGGLAYKGLLPTRPGDTAGFAVAYARIGNQARWLDLDYRSFGMSVPVRSAEIVLEASYQAQITPWWTLQPDVQLIVNPGGGAANADGAPRRNALVAGLRTTVAF